MTLNFDNNKNCKAIENISKDSTDRTFVKEFSKRYNANLLKQTVKICKRLTLAENAHAYNMIASADNKIELLSGVKNNEPTVLKIRVQDGYRKLFHFFCKDQCSEFSLYKDWIGQFTDIDHIYIYEMNKHNYSKA
ncbi:hypothetical protein [Chryseobacterium flavum]|uniref:hypothetical protein n=1 Tax=Chryseobacterium flavum TaxID=415851 RepID=UPI0028AB669B|nr:hypothetical protein [Chryseobacterium flavum]